MRKVIYVILFGLFILQISGCRSVLSEQKSMRDSDILELVYSDKRVPEDFYSEEEFAGDKSVIYIRKSNPINDDGDVIFWTSTDDVEEARGYVTEFLAKNNYSKIYSESENKKYFEFLSIDASNDVTKIRVHKKSYIDLIIPDSEPVYILNERPINQQNVKEIIEYLWLMENYQTRGSNVVSSNIEESNNEIKYTMYETKTIFGDWGINDQIILSETIYTVDKKSGEIKESSNKIKTIKGKHNNKDGA